MAMATQVAALPDDALAGVFRALPPRSVAVVRCVCKAWRGIVDGRSLLRPHLLPRSVRGVFVNYIDGHDRPHHFSRPCSSSTTFPLVDGELGFLPTDNDWSSRWSVLDHCGGLLLCDAEVEPGSELCVCNPATRRWTALPRRPDGMRLRSRRLRWYAGAYLAFDPAASPHYHVVLDPDDLPEAPSSEERRTAAKERRARLIWEKEKDLPFCLDWFFSDDSFGASGEEEEEETEEAYHVHDEGEFRQQLPSTVVEEEDDEQLEREIDPWRFMEWPPTQWAMQVFSSRTGQWEERAFVRQGMAAGTVEEMRLDPQSHWSRWPYAVYHHGSLYVHCRGSFLTRLSLSTNNYRVIGMPPANLECERPYLGKLQNNVCFGIIHDCQLKIWILNESWGQMEWLLKHEVEVGRYAQCVQSIPYDHSGTKPKGSWIVEGSIDIHDTGHHVESQSEESYEWDSDNDDIFTVDTQQSQEDYRDNLRIMGFHPYKEVVFMVQTFRVIAYHLNSTKIQYLGEAHPKCYHFNHSYGIYGSFVYTPGMIGDLLHGNQNDHRSSED